jgi:hypothetical protein
MATRMCMPDNACRGISVEGAQTGGTTHYSGHIVDVDNPRHVRALRSMGAFVASATGARATGGYACLNCGFQSYFKACSRCGGECVPA